MMRAKMNILMHQTNYDLLVSRKSNAPPMPADGLSKDKHLINKLGHDKHFCAPNTDK